MPTELNLREKELFSLISQGDEPAFKELFHLFEPKIKPLILSLVSGDQAVAKDIIQDVFLQLWLGRAKLPDVEAPDKWIFKLTYNCSYSLLRKKIVREKYIKEHEESESHPHEQNPTEELLVFAETSRLIDRAVQDLPPRAKQIFLLRESGMKREEIARQLGISAQTVNNTISHALKEIRMHLRKNGIDLPLFLIMLFL